MATKFTINIPMNIFVDTENPSQEQLDSIRASVIAMLRDDFFNRDNVYDSANEEGLILHDLSFGDDADDSEDEEEENAVAQELSEEQKSAYDDFWRYAKETEEEIKEAQ